MNSITIKNLDGDLILAIQRLAKSEGQSLGDTVINLLRKALNLNDQDGSKRDVSKFFGIWTKDEKMEFNEAIKIFEQI